MLKRLACQVLGEFTMLMVMTCGISPIRDGISKLLLVTRSKGSICEFITCVFFAGFFQWIVSESFTHGIFFFGFCQPSHIAHEHATARLKKLCGFFHHELRAAGGQEQRHCQRPHRSNGLCYRCSRSHFNRFATWTNGKNTGDGERICRKMGAWKKLCQGLILIHVHDVHPRKLTWEWTNKVTTINEDVSPIRNEMIFHCQGVYMSWTEARCDTSSFER